MTKAAIALDGSVVSEHFGKVREFLFVTFEIGREISREVLPAPTADHAPGVFPNWVKSMGADMVMAGGMGVKAKQFSRPSESRSSRCLPWMLKRV
jgi:predicted Fe-Mo cluster-binding NifX family protein